MSIDPHERMAPALAPDDPRVRRPSFRNLLETFDYGMVVFDDQGVITYASPVVSDLAGRPIADIVGVNILDFIEPSEVAFALESLAFLLAHPFKSRQPIELHLGFEGTRRLSEVSAAELSSDPRVGGTAVMLRDGTLRGMLEDILESVMVGDHIERTLGLIAALCHEELRGSGVVITHREAVGCESGRMVLGVPDELLEAAAHDAATELLVVEDAISFEGDPWLSARGYGVSLQRSDELPEDLRETARAAGYRGRWRAPLMSVDGRPLGLLTVWTRDENPPSPSEENGLVRLARTAAFGVDRWQRDQLLEHAARHDTLTGLPNRTVFEQAVGRELDPVVLYFDLDHFKAVNDVHGHLVGDQVLAIIARRLTTVVRPNDLVARLGGDEFAVLCRCGAGEAAAIDVAERLIAAACEPVVAGSVRVAVGASVGLATGEPSDVLARADAALRRAKSDGRGRVHRW